MLIFSDGLYERRGIDLDEAFARLIDEIGSGTALDLHDLCDALLGSASHEDDIALIAVRSKTSPHGTATS
ncbi:hypothetical protein GCM10009836_03360 [Pseudonocardia ailaonensis]|uniref:PPM-type phosphatase domain-containing protein n=1 Tax=Pseudonocardia ailaonensis TaxID=367279 RepID=A0ABN2MKA0_9PSEU